MATIGGEIGGLKPTLEQDMATAPTVTELTFLNRGKGKGWILLPRSASTEKRISRMEFRRKLA
jgi:hypothetical protein